MTKSTQSRRTVFADRIEYVKKNKFELKRIKFGDCFLDGYGKNKSNFVSCKKTLCELTFFRIPKNFLNQLVVKMI